MQNKILASATIFLGLFMAAMESLIGSTILPSILSSLGGFDLYPWMVSAFLLSLVITTPLFGKMADHYGFYKTYLIAIGFFMVGSLFCGLSRTMPEMILSRVIQGVGTGGLINLCMIYVGIAFPTTMRHKIGAVVSSVWAIASLLGPTLSAFITAYTSWRFAFLINVPLTILMLLGTLRWLKDLPQPKNANPFDYKGATLFSVAALFVLSMLMGFSKAELRTYELFLATGAVLFSGWLYLHSNQLKNSFISLNTLKEHPIVAYSVAIGFCCGVFLFSTSNLLPLFVQGSQGNSVKQVGFVVASMAVGTCLGSGLTALLLGRLGFRNCLTFSSLFIILGLGQMILLNQASTLGNVLFANFLFGTGIGMSSNGSIVAAQIFSPRSKLGTHTSLFGFFRSVGGMIAIAVIGALQLYFFREGVSSDAGELWNSEASAAFQHPELMLDPTERSKLSEFVLEKLEVSLAHSIRISFLALIPAVLFHLWAVRNMPTMRPHEVELVPDPQSIGE
ncbi:MAG: MFS transporter [Parachlamydiaceae bacterium]